MKKKEKRKRKLGEGEIFMGKAAFPIGKNKIILLLKLNPPDWLNGLQGEHLLSFSTYLCILPKARVIEAIPETAL
jgi:hypothetical protein